MKKSTRKTTHRKKAVPPKSGSRKLTEKALIGTLTISLGYVAMTLSILELIKAVTKLSKEELDNITATISKKSQSIVEMMVDNRAKNAQKAYTVFAITLLGQFAFAYFSKIATNFWFTLLVLILASATYLNQTILVYRIKKGLYGANDYEARELIEFIFQNVDYIDFNDGNSRKKIMPEPEEEMKENIIPEGGMTA
jgi:hypothetical protein